MARRAVATFEPWTLLMIPMAGDMTLPARGGPAARPAAPPPRPGTCVREDQGGRQRAAGQVVQIFNDVLCRTDVAPGDDFFTLQGESIQAVQIAARLAAASGRDITPRDIFNGLTVAELAELLPAFRGSSGSLA
jgi:hypothetical protein